jgi:hypothetical protein
MQKGIYELVEEGNTEAALDLLFKTIDSWLCAGKFDECNTFLRLVDIERLNVTLMVGVLATTLSAKNKLPDRVALVEKIEGYLSLHEPKRVNSLLVNLR